MQIPMGIYASSTDLHKLGSTRQYSLTALGPILFSLPLANETIPLVCAIVYTNDLASKIPLGHCGKTVDWPMLAIIQYITNVSIFTLKLMCLEVSTLHFSSVQYPNVTIVLMFTIKVRCSPLFGKIRDKSGGK